MKNKTTDELIQALRTRFKATFTSNDHNQTDALVLGYLKGMLGVLEESNDGLRSSLEWHLKDATEYNQEKGL